MLSSSFTVYAVSLTINQFTLWSQHTINLGKGCCQFAHVHKQHNTGSVSETLQANNTYLVARSIKSCRHYTCTCITETRQTQGMRIIVVFLLVSMVNKAKKETLITRNTKQKVVRSWVSAERLAPIMVHTEQTTLVNDGQCIC
jgi:hypothetical protein